MFGTNVFLHLSVRTRRGSIVLCSLDDPKIRLILILYYHGQNISFIVVTSLLSWIYTQLRSPRYHILTWCLSFCGAPGI
ncbi:hypothetical protein M405DRAFT_367971 [Rhizopogon salebrosus TDB-379]|nr:hypothetical protein M405DRAFT_367971 [Rhizopogon salebrosus TDB-379]